MVNTAKIIYRPMEIADYQACYDLWGKTPGMKIERADSRDAIATYLQKNPNLSFVALDGADVVGTVLCGEDGRRGYLQHLCVEPNYRRKNIASELISRAVKSFEKLELFEIRLFIFTDNDLGNDFWEHHNWVIRDNIYVRAFHLSSAD